MRRALLTCLGGKNFHLYHPTADIESGVVQAIRAAFEYSGQKCSALARCYVPKSLWEGGFRDSLVKKVNAITVGPCTEWEHFTGPVINKPAFERITGIIEEAKQAGGEVIAGGDCECAPVCRGALELIGVADGSKGYFVKPTVILTKDPKSVTMTKEIFGPVMTVSCSSNPVRAILTGRSTYTRTPTLKRLAS